MTNFSTKSVRMSKEFAKNGRTRNITYLQRCTTRLEQDQAERDRPVKAQYICSFRDESVQNKLS